MSKHNGINATREALKDQLVLAADRISELLDDNQRLRLMARIYRDEAKGHRLRDAARPLARLARAFEFASEANFGAWLARWVRKVQS